MTEGAVDVARRLREALSLAKQATNGWACHAKRKIEHDEIARLHEAIEVIARSGEEPTESQNEQAWRDLQADGGLPEAQAAVKFNI